MTPTDPGFTHDLTTCQKINNCSDLSVGRVAQEHHERYFVSTGDGEPDTELTWNLRFSPDSGAEFAADGSRIAMTIFDSTMTIAHQVTF